MVDFDLSIVVKVVANIEWTKYCTSWWSSWRF